VPIACICPCSFEYEYGWLALATFAGSPTPCPGFLLKATFLHFSEQNFKNCLLAFDG